MAVVVLMSGITSWAEEASAVSFSLSGRSVHGRMGLPENINNKQGRVVVEITVDQQGKVVHAIARALGTTVQDAELWKAAERAAMETLFNSDPRAAIMQRGTITYIFRVDLHSLCQSDEQGAKEASAAGETDARTLYRGQTEGQHPNSTSDEVSSFSLAGRSVHGRMGQPVNTSNKQGRVVVEITVDQQGRVVQAKARAAGSTVEDTELWRSAEKAAMETLFNVDTRAAVMQRGTITYIFRLR